MCQIKTHSIKLLKLKPSSLIRRQQTQQGAQLERPMTAKGPNNIPLSLLYLFQCSIEYNGSVSLCMWTKHPTLISQAPSPIQMLKHQSPKTKIPQPHPGQYAAATPHGLTLFPTVFCIEYQCFPYPLQSQFPFVPDGLNVAPPTTA